MEGSGHHVAHIKRSPEDSSQCMMSIFFQVFHNHRHSLHSRIINESGHVDSL